MLLWEYLYRADQRIDLAHPDRAAAWLGKQPWCPTEVLDPDAEQAIGIHQPEWQVAWCENVRAFRSLAKRLASRRPRHRFPDGRLDRKRADERCNRYLGQMRIVVRPAEQPSPVQQWTTLTRANITRDVTPTIEAPDGHRQPHWSHAGQLLSLEVFWQLVFWSLVEPVGAPPACERCGRLFPVRTPSGRPSKRGVCQRCSSRRWTKQQDKDDVRQAWRLQKRRQRAAHRAARDEAT